MSFHHLAIATRDMKATHEFYSGAMGFELVRAEKAQMPGGDWAKHFFYDTGNGEMMAFWELHLDEIADDFPTSISAGLGLPAWTNHIAFGADSLDDLGTRRQEFLDPRQQLGVHGLENLRLQLMDPDIAGEQR